MVLCLILVNIHVYLLFINLHVFNFNFNLFFYVIDLEKLKETEQNFFYCHSAPCYKLETIHDEPNIILSCSEDGTVRQYDLRTNVKCTKRSCDDVNQMILI